MAIDAINASGVPCTELRVPERKGQGRSTGLGEVAIKRDLPGFATLSGMSVYWCLSFRGLTPESTPGTIK